MKVILTNDDGIEAPGFKALIDSLPDGFEAIAVAPESEQSACSHAISLGKKFHVKEKTEKGIRHYAVEGTPADCVKFAISELNDFVPDLIVSGINPRFLKVFR